HRRHGCWGRLAVGLLDGKMPTSEAWTLLCPHEPADLDCLFELFDPGPGPRKRIAVCHVLFLSVTGAQAEDQTSPREGLESGRHLRQERWIAVAHGEHLVADVDFRIPGREPGEGRPGLEEGIGSPRVTVEVITDPNRIEPDKRL